jgi:hypothetical protein
VQRPQKTWKKTDEEEAMKMGKTWIEVKRIAVERIRWKNFTDALFSRTSDGN